MVLEGLKAKIAAIDPDDAFAYSTLKIVTIRDRRLGILHYLLQLGIFIYIIVFTIIVQQRYLKTQTPVGSIRATVATPSYTDASTLPYCKQNSDSYNGFTNLNCAYLQGYDVTYPPAPVDSIYVATRIRDSIYLTNSTAQAGCSDPPTTLECAPPTVANYRVGYYVAGIESFTIFMEHSIFGDNVDIATTNGAGALKGEFFSGNGTRILFTGKRAGDIIPLSEIFGSAGVKTLDQASGLTQDNGSPDGNSLRYDGLSMLCIVTYSNRQSASKELKYSYDFYALKGSDVVAQAPSVKNEDGFVQRTFHGARIVFVITGTIGVFDFPTLLTSIVNGFVLLKVATTIVDLMLLYIMPERALYKQSKFQFTEDFSDVRKSQEMKKKGGDVDAIE